MENHFVIKVYPEANSMEILFQGYLTRHSLDYLFERLLENSVQLKENFVVYVDITKLQSSKNEVRMALNGIRNILKNSKCRQIEFVRPHDSSSIALGIGVGKYAYKNEYISQ